MFWAQCVDERLLECYDLNMTGGYIVNSVGEGPRTTGHRFTKLLTNQTECTQTTTCVTGPNVFLKSTSENWNISISKVVIQGRNVTRFYMSCYNCNLTNCINCFNDSEIFILIPQLWGSQTMYPI